MAYSSTLVEPCVDRAWGTASVVAKFMSIKYQAPRIVGTIYPKDIIPIEQLVYHTCINFRCLSLELCIILDRNNSHRGMYVLMDVHTHRRALPQPLCLSNDTTRFARAF